MKGCLDRFSLGIYGSITWNMRDMEILYNDSKKNKGLKIDSSKGMNPPIPITLMYSNPLNDSYDHTKRKKSYTMQ